jgi:hypothetical protein
MSAPYPLELRAGEFWVKKGNIFPAAADSGLIGFIAPTDQEFTVVDADDDCFLASHQPAKLSCSSKPAARTSQPGLSCRQRSAEIVADVVSVLAKMAGRFGDACPRVAETELARLRPCFPAFSPAAHHAANIFA